MDPHHPLDVTCVAVSQFMSVYSALAVWMVSAIQHFRVWLPSVFHDHRWLMLVPYILALAIFVSRHEVVRYLTDSSNPVTALSSHHYSVKISMYEKARTSLDLLPLPSAFGRALAPTAECRTEAFLHPQAINQPTFQHVPRRQQQ